ncbi:L-threonylcarbamoyladenylate synthase [Niabella hibiscisoli]|uniref:L-threonylcarbamoyladenylate synthase n=1 Tax=Niabella hibiscisoli TaxID=1825928 RepID=UPI001F1015E5|nr:L-threonylcarbamoyladenylate synthase [Niabella hibiscisoli]MCH5715493.1 threonylcarbamoyl-AMP synthase [Niabella hibiscisoli]
MLLRIHPKDPQERLIKQVAETLRNGGIIVYPTDTIYGLGCDIYQTKAIEQICRIKQIDPKKAQLSFVCCDLSHLSDFARQISNTTYRVLKEHLPGPYTFILPASKQVPKILQSKKDTIGLRVPDNKIVHELVKELGHPILSTTLPGEFVEDYTDPEIIYEKYKNLVDIVVDGGIGGTKPSTIINCVNDDYEVVRLGAGEWEQ